MPLAAEQVCTCSWVPRHPELIRLTGRHPFNCEPPLSTVMDKGFITPCSLVRNSITCSKTWTALALLRWAASM